jgi:hypothetical protein
MHLKEGQLHIKLSMLIYCVTTLSELKNITPVKFYLPSLHR